MTNNNKSISKNRFLSFFICFLLMCATALCVNKALFGHSFRQTETAVTVVDTDTISTLPDGTTVIHTALLTKEAGYAGPVPLDVYVRNDSIVDIKALPNAETPGFFRRAEVILSEWVGKTTGQAAALKVDAVSGATYSSDAIIANVNEALTCYSSVSAKKTLLFR